MKMRWPCGFALLCLSQSLLAQGLTAEEIRQIVRDEVQRQLALHHDGAKAEPTTESVLRALSDVKRKDKWYDIPTGDAAPRVLNRQETSIISRDLELQPQAMPGSNAAGALVDMDLVSPADALSGPAGVSTADNAVQQGKSAIELVATTEGTSAVITLGTKADAEFDAVSRLIKKDGWNFTASAPLDKSSGEATFASLNGLANGFTLGVSRTYSRTRGKSEKEPTSWSRIFGFNAEIGYDDFTYYTSLTQKEKDREMHWSAGGSLGTSSPLRKAYFGAGFELQRAYESNKPRIVCPLTTDTTFDCVQGSFGAPQRGYQRIAFVEARSALFDRPYNIRLAHDFASDRSSVDLPIYLLRNKQNKFTGGIRLGWNSDNDFIAGVFVGKEFSIDPNSNE